MNIKAIIPLLALLTALNPTLAQDQSFEEDLKLLGNDFNLEVEGETNLSYSTASKVQFHHSYVSLSLDWQNKIRTTITTRLDHIFKEQGIRFAKHFNLGTFIKEAFIEIKEVNGAPVAVVVGKQPIPFGQNVEAMPLFQNSPLDQSIEEVFGFTVDLQEGIFGVFDQVELSLFETESGDFEIGRMDGVSVRMSKLLTDQFLMTLSHAQLGNTHTDTGHEKRTSIGLIGESTDGVLVGWIEGFIFSNNPKYQNSNYGVTLGALMKLNGTTDVIVEYSYIEKEIKETGIGLKKHLSDNLQAGIEVRYNNRDKLTFGIGVSYQFGAPVYNDEDDDYLFDEE